MQPSAFERIILAFITALPPTLMAAAAFIAALRAYRQSAQAVDRLNGRLDQLVRAEVERAKLKATLEAQSDAVRGVPPPRANPRPGGSSPPARTDPDRP